jgi:putative tryptophan/tyrosine transport system substrate-binding protein
MRRREFIAGLGGAAAWSLAARAQQSAMPVIGFLHNASPETSRERIASFHRGLAETGYVEGQTVAIEYRWAQGQSDRLAALAADLVRRKVAVIATPGYTQSALVAKAATQTIPIVFLLGADPVEIGLVASLNRPGGNLTGVSMLNSEFVGKLLGMMHELVPAAKSIALLVNPTNPSYAAVETREALLAARVLGVRSRILNASRPSEIEAAFANLVQQQTDALFVGADNFFSSQQDQLVALAARYAIPTIYQFREFTAAGGLMSYGPSNTEAYRIVGVYTGRILKGEKPADLPVQQVTKIELVINLKTAKALGLTIPETLLATADEVIQ